ncbi:hypothetical protein ABZ345_24450 [Lentzea sp. NPDC005914]|uniref:hypothetical protein n=1 Tax=Lentzea sp. NPDC005914 TaxID=3154572 RepID=UPI0033DD4082
MSAIFLLDREDVQAYDTWNVPGGLFFWVLDVIADRVRDEELAAALREFLKGGYAWFALTYYTPDQAADIVRVIRTELKAVAEEESPSSSARNEGLHRMVDELVEMAERWHATA